MVNRRYLDEYIEGLGQDGSNFIANVLEFQEVLQYTIYTIYISYTCIHV